ncbi:MAG: T9SS type A sorting domain-containing protein, partial [Gemmatimonadetes bacterium]|nr:T9SS type A sorting domain-containing protein [Gemmatimonadota bacterium]
QDTLRVALETDTDTLLGDAALLNLTFQVHDDPRPGTAALQLIDPVLGDGTTAPRSLHGSLQRIGTDAQLLADTSGFALPHRLVVGVDDRDEDRTEFPDTVTITLSEGDTTESLRLAEDANHSGKFRGVIDLLHAPQVAADGRLQVLPRRPFNLCYTDSLDGHGSTTDLCVDRHARGHDAVLQVSKVIEPGDTLWLRVRDRDLNRDSALVEHGMVTLQVGDSTLDHWLDAVDPALDSYDGTVSSSSNTTGFGALQVTPGDWVIVSYLDTAAAAGDFIIRTDTSIVIERFGDADGNGLLQAFDANVILRHVVQPALSGADSLAANVDSLAPMSAVTPLDAAMLLQQRVGLRSRFPVQLRSSVNHPGPYLVATVAERKASSPSKTRIATRASLRVEGEDLLLWLDDLSGTIAAEVEIRELQAQDVEAAASGFLAAHRRVGDNWHVALAGALPLTGSGPLLRFRQAAKSPETTIKRIRINDETIVMHPQQVTPPLPSRWRMAANHPNPFNGSTLIPLTLVDPAHVDVVIHNLLGQQVRRLLRHTLTGGEHLLRWNGLNDEGLQLATGVYIVRVRLAGTERRQRIMLLR